MAPWGPHEFTCAVPAGGWVLQGMGETLASECRLDSIALPAGEKALQLRGLQQGAGAHPH